MTELTRKQRNELNKLEKAIDSTRVEWLATYELLKSTEGLAVKVHPGSTAGTLYDQLVNLRTQRNGLLKQWRDAGYDI